MRHLRNDRTTAVIIKGHAFVQNLCRGHYRLTTGVPTTSASPPSSTNSATRDLINRRIHRVIGLVHRSADATPPVRRRQVLAGLINEYSQAA